MACIVSNIVLFIQTESIYPASKMICLLFAQNNTLATPFEIKCLIHVTNVERMLKEIMMFGSVAIQLLIAI